VAVLPTAVGEVYGNYHIGKIVLPQYGSLSVDFFGELLIWPTPATSTHSIDTYAQNIYVY
jgi:hypothetical protein